MSGSSRSRLDERGHQGGGVQVAAGLLRVQDVRAAAQGAVGVVDVRDLRVGTGLIGDFIINLFGCTGQLLRTSRHASEVYAGRANGIMFVRSMLTAL